MKKIRSYLLARLAGLVVVAVMAVAYAVQTPAVQTRISRRVLDKFRDAFDGRLSYGELGILPSGALIIRDVLLIDNEPYTEDVSDSGRKRADTVIMAKSISATFSPRTLFGKKSLHIGRADIHDGYFHLVIEPGEYQNNISRIFRVRKEPDKEPGDFTFDISKAEVHGCRFRMNSYNESKRPEPDGPAIDFDDMDVRFSVIGSRLKYSRGTVRGRIDEFEALEKSGYHILGLSADFSAGPKKAVIENVRLNDGWTDLNLKEYSMFYDSSGAFSDYIGEVRMKAEFRPSSVAMKSISYFAGMFSGNQSIFEIRRGTFDGYVNDFKVGDFEFKDVYSGVSGQTAVTFTGLPELASMLARAEIKDFRFTLPQLDRFISGFGATMPGELLGRAGQESFRLDAEISGPVRKLKVSGNLYSTAGQLSIVSDVRNLMDGHRDLEIGGTLAATSVNLGRFTGSTAIGDLSFRTKFSTSIGKDFPEIHIDSLEINGLDALGYKYSRIEAKADIMDGSATASLRSDDPNLRFGLEAYADLSPDRNSRKYTFSGLIENADLNALNLDKRGKSVISMSLDGDFTGKGRFLEGNAVIGGLRLENIDGASEIGDLHFRAYRLGADQYFTMEAPFADLRLCGTYGFSKMFGDIMNITLRRELGALYADNSDYSLTSCGHYELDARLHDSMDLLAFLVPGLYIADSTSVRADINSDGSLYGSVISPRIAYGSNNIKNAVLHFDNAGGRLSTWLRGEKVRAGNMEMSSPRMEITAGDNSLALGLSFEKVPGISEGGEIFVDGLLYRDSTNTLVVKAHPMESYLSIGQTVWNIGESDIAIRDKDIYVDNFNIRSGEQSIVLDGGISRDRSDTLFLNINGVDLAIADEFLPKRYGIKGTLGGRTFLNSEKGRALGLLSDMTIDSLNVGGVDAGNFRFSVILEDQGEDVELFLRNDREGRDAFYASGLYYLDDGRVDVTAELDKFPANVAGVFLEDIFDSIDGSLSGRIRLQGPLNRLSTSSNGLRVEDLAAKISITGVEYTVNGPLHMDNSGLYFDRLSIRDNDRGSGTFYGKLYFDHLRNFGLDSRLDISDMKVIDAPEGKDRSIYGLLRAGGYANINGPVNSLMISCDIYSSGEGNVHIPTSNVSGGPNSDLLTFTEKTVDPDPFEEVLGNMKKAKAPKSDMSIRADVSVSPAVKIAVEIDKSSGNVAAFSGSGNVSIALRPLKDIFNLNGDFIISEGSYQFAIPGIISKEFSVRNGSSVKFGGPLMDTEIDVTATYRLKASLAPLMQNTENDGIKRTVECGINISDRLRNPRISLSIDVPDLNPTSKSQVESALATEDKIQKQFLSLLLMSSFIPDERSGVFNSEDMLLSNITGLMANQLNSILQKLDIPLDVGIGYQGLSDGDNVFDVAISTQLFNDRVLVGGSVANRKYNNAGNSDMIGDLDIQIKLDPEGRFRFNLFSHSADEYSSYLDLSQRNGVGMSYQKEFGKFEEFLRSLFRRSPEQEETPNKEQTVIKIEENDGIQR